jgi:hypothetical protein
MSNLGEPLLNTVTWNKPKVLTGLGQKARGRDEELLSLLTQTIPHRWRGGIYPIPRSKHGTW